MFWLVAILMIGGAWWVYADLQHRINPLKAAITVIVLVLAAFAIGALIAGVISKAMWFNQIIEAASVVLFSLAGRSISKSLRKRIGD